MRAPCAHSALTSAVGPGAKKRACAPSVPHGVSVHLSEVSLLLSISSPLLNFATNFSSIGGGRDGWWHPSLPFPSPPPLLPFPPSLSLLVSRVGVGVWVCVGVVVRVRGCTWVRRVRVHGEGGAPRWPDGRVVHACGPSTVSLACACAALALLAQP